MVTRKLVKKVKKEKPKLTGPAVVKVRRSLKIDPLPDVIVSGTFTCDVGDTIILRRDYLKDVTMSYLTVTEINVIDGWLIGWDESRHQWAPRLNIAESDQFTLKKVK